MTEFLMVDVIKLKALSDRRLWLRFSDGHEGEWDFSPLLSKDGAMIEPLREPSMFARVFVEMGAPTWPSGFDVDPAYLYMQMMAAGALTYKVAA
ncbi:MAG: DUF2442 domain-containing protein [Bosea sp. (in: a-proteobacteria)]